MEKQSLGPFKAKDKRAIDLQINELNQKLRVVLNSKSDSVMRYEASIAQSKKRIAEINNILTKSRLEL